MDITPIPDGMPFQFGDQTFRFGDTIVELKNSSHLIDQPDQLRNRLDLDGYLFLRGFHPINKVKIARNFTLKAIEQQGGLKEGAPIEDGIASKNNQSFAFFRQTDIAHASEVLAVVDSQSTFSFYERLLGGTSVITFDKRWLRCMARGGNNHFHYDQVYVGRGTPNRYTMWSAFTAIDLTGGPLVICLGSHQHQRLRETYGATDMDRDLTEAVFSTDPAEMVDKFGFTLATARFQPGDVIIFGMYMMHSSAPNLTDSYRISIDTRYQLAAEEKDDRFFFQPNGSWLGNFYNHGAKYTPMAELRKQWGLV